MYMYICIYVHTYIYITEPIAAEYTLPKTVAV
jgi:hypothetical protein